MSETKVYRAEHAIALQQIEMSRADVKKIARMELLSALALELPNDGTPFAVAVSWGEEKGAPWECGNWKRETTLITMEARITTE